MKSVYRVINRHLDAEVWNRVSSRLGADLDAWPIDSMLGENEDFDMGALGELRDIFGFINSDPPTARF